MKALLDLVKLFKGIAYLANSLTRLVGFLRRAGNKRV